MPYFQPPYPLSQTLRWEKAIFICISNHFVLQNDELSCPNGRNSISRYFFSQNPECRFILFQYTSVHLCTRFGDLKPTINERQRPQIWTFFCARHRNNIMIAQGNCNFLSTGCFINVKLLIDHHYQQSVLCKTRKRQNLELCSGTNVGVTGDQPIKIWEKLYFSSYSA